MTSPDADAVRGNNRRIARNTLYLYLRMAVVVVCGLWTSRIVLQTLGASDYGLYNAVAGVVGMLAYMDALLAGAASRFLTVAQGRGDRSQLQATFATTLLLGLMAAAVVLVVTLTAGLWFVGSHLNVEPGRLGAARWVCVSAGLTCALSMVQVAYTASVIAHEQMSFYAYLSIVEVVMKLGTAAMLLWWTHGRLELYAMMQTGVGMVSLLMAWGYCRRRFDECRTAPGLAPGLMRQMASYSGWNLAGALAYVCNNYGTGILTNIFFGTLANAARGVAQQVSDVVMRFCSSFQMASQPQIMKYYARQALPEMHALMVDSSRYSALLLLCVAVPLGVMADGVLALWLAEVPVWSADFVRASLVYMVARAIDAPLGMGIHAVGRMRVPAMTTSVIYLLTFPATWAVMALGGGPVWAYHLLTASACCCMAIDLAILRAYVALSPMRWVHGALLPVSGVVALSLAASIGLRHVAYDGSAVGCLGVTAACVGATLACVYTFGLGPATRAQVALWLRARVGRVVDRIRL